MSVITMFKNIVEKRRTPIELPQKYIHHTRLLVNRKFMLTKLPKYGVVAEIGTLYGKYSREILDSTHPKKLHLIDINITNRLMRTVEKEIDQGVAVLHEGDSIEVINTFSDRYFDWVYIDSSHSYEQTKRELGRCRTKVKKGGYICGDDYIDFEYVANRHYGVVAAVNEFCVKFGWEIRYLTNEPQRFISFALKEMTRTL